jgi:nicotinamide-nucleotide amidase
MPVAEIIAIGTELLLGEIQDTNTRYVARTLRDAGVDLYRTTIIGDNAERIARAIQESMQRAQIIITTGGLGPTVDDPTRQAVALALGVETEFRPELWEQIEARFKRFGRQATENNRRQAYIPQGAQAIENEVGTAPAFRAERGEVCIFSLPGVPREMEYLFEKKVLPYLKTRYALSGTIQARLLHVAGVGESQIDEWIGDLETSQNPTVGLAAHAGQIDIRVAAKAASASEASQMIEKTVQAIYQRLGEHIYGEDDVTLEKVIQQKLNEHGWSLAVLECNFNQAILKQLQPLGFDDNRFQVVAQPCDEAELQRQTAQLQQKLGSDVALGASVQPDGERQALTLVLFTPHGVKTSQRFYGGPSTMGLTWATNTALDFLRRNLG